MELNKVMKAPEKLYFFEGEPILSARSKQREDANIEYTRTDAIKAKEVKLTWKDMRQIVAISDRMLIQKGNLDDKTYGCIAHDSFCLEDFGLKDMDKVKMILIKDD